MVEVSKRRSLIFQDGRWSCFTCQESKLWMKHSFVGQTEEIFVSEMEYLCNPSSSLTRDIRVLITSSRLWREGQDRPKNDQVTEAFKSWFYYTVY